MGIYVVRRLLQTAVTLLLLGFAVFLLARITGDPVTILLPLDAPAEAIAEVRRTLGLDKPLPVQLLRFYSSLLRGELGYSFRDGRPVTSLLRDRFPRSLQLAAFAFGVAVIGGIPLGVSCARGRGKSWDSFVRGL